MAAVVMRRLSSSSTTSKRASPANDAGKLTSILGRSPVWLAKCFMAVLRGTLLLVQDWRVYLKNNAKGRTLAFVAANLNTTPMLPHDILRYTQPQSCAFLAG